MREKAALFYGWRVVGDGMTGDGWSVAADGWRMADGGEKRNEENLKVELLGSNSAK